MRTLILTLAVVLLAAPVWADVAITLSVDGKVVTIGYDATGEGQLVRAFALDVQATDGNIIDINDFAIGDNNGGYGIFPGKFASVPIDVNPTTGLVDNWNKAGYSPVAPAGDPDALGDIPGPGITIELGSLYEDAPPLGIGVLCTITVDENVTKVCVKGNAIRGNVVLEDASQATTNVDVDPVCIDIPGDGCFPSDHPDYDVWVAVGKPECWCYPRQCHGDANGGKEGSPFTGYTYVAGADLGALAAAWQIKDPPQGPGLSGNQICADFDHVREGSPFTGYYRVGGLDLGILATYWQKKEAPQGTGIATDCGGTLEP